jgi:hypothetical protein
LTAKQNAPAILSFMKIKYIHLLSLGAIILDQGAYGTLTTATTADQAANQPPSPIDIDSHDWEAKQKAQSRDDIRKKLNDLASTFRNWRKESPLAKSSLSGSDWRKIFTPEWGLQDITAAYIYFFYPELEGEELENKATEIGQILVNERNEQVDHRTFSANIYGNETFFNQTAAPLRQLTTSVILKTLEQDRLDLEDDAAVQSFYEKIMMFAAIARNTIARVSMGPARGPLFGNPINQRENLCEFFGVTFSASQIHFARWLASDAYPIKPSIDELLWNQDYYCPFGGTIGKGGNVYHSCLDMFYVGNRFFKECMVTAKRLKENPNDPEALIVFTLAMKKFMYTWSQSSTFWRGQAAILGMLVDSIAKYTGFQLKRPKVTKEARAVLMLLTKKFLNQIKLAENPPQKNDETWLQDFYYHYDVFALHMPTFKKFDERYKCEFVPIGTDETVRAEADETPPESPAENTLNTTPLWRRIWNFIPRLFGEMYQIVFAEE